MLTGGTGGEEEDDEEGETPEGHFAGEFPPVDEGEGSAGGFGHFLACEPVFCELRSWID